MDGSEMSGGVERTTGITIEGDVPSHARPTRGPRPRRGVDRRAAGLEKLLSAYRPLVVATAAKYDERHREDAIIEGVRGLLDAIRRFAPGSGGTLDAHCAYWVQRRMLERFSSARGE